MRLQPGTLRVEGRLAFFARFISPINLSLTGEQREVSSEDPAPLFARGIPKNACGFEFVLLACAKAHVEEGDARPFLPFLVEIGTKYLIGELVERDRLIALRSNRPSGMQEWYLNDLIGGFDLRVQLEEKPRILKILYPRESYFLIRPSDVVMDTQGNMVTTPSFSASPEPS